MGSLCFFSSLFMAMPISVLGNAMSHAWTDAHVAVGNRQTHRMSLIGLPVFRSVRRMNRIQQTCLTGQEQQRCKGGPGVQESQPRQGSKSYFAHGPDAATPETAWLPSR